MKYSFKKINIEAPFPTTQCGHSCQTYEVTEFKDHLFARVSAFDDGINWIIHFSMDLLAFNLKDRNDLQERIREYYKCDRIQVITSTTHTHYANSVRTDKYLNYLKDVLVEGIKDMEYTEKDNLSTSYQRFHTNAVGKSRISGYETGNEYLCLIRFYENDNNFFSIVFNNCHPTILKATVPYFSAEYPGYVLRKLEETYPDTDFTYLQGPSGDISSRFVRDGQDYEAMEKLGNNLYKEVVDLINKPALRKPMKLKFKAYIQPYEHDFTPVDMSNMPENLTERELETIKLGQEQRKKLEASANKIFGIPAPEGLICSLDIGAIKLVFFPNELFSEYMNFVNLDEKLIVSYSNGYGPYVLPIGFRHVTYEMFTDTLSKKTKEEIIEVFKTI